MTPDFSNVVNVVIATPLGKGGKGGIDRIMDEVRSESEARPSDHVRCEFIVTRGQGHIAMSAIHFPLALAKLTALKLRGKADILHINLSSHGSTARKIVLARWARRLGIPYVLHLHGSRMRQYWLGSDAAMQQKIRTMFADASRILVLGNVWRTFVMDQVPSAADRIIILPNATRAARIAHVPGDKVRILFLGRVGERKGVPQLVDALGRLSEVSGWHAIIAGDGDLAPIRAQVERLGLANRIDMPGWVGPADVERLLSQSDVLVLPSFDENLPMSVIEAMGAGLAVVTTPVGATEDIVTDGVSGLLVPPGTVEPLAAALGRLIAEPQLRHDLGAAAKRTHAERLEISPYVDRLRTIWHDAAQSHPSRSH